VEYSRIGELLQPFLVTPLPFSGSTAHPLTVRQLACISTYIDLLLRWNARINLTAVRDPEKVVTRHFGESLCAARAMAATRSSAPARLADVGSGSGFPGLAIKIFVPEFLVTLIESNHKKATFLREVIRALDLTGVDVFPKRAEDFPPASADVVTLRAVERFDSILPVAAGLVAPGGTLLLLIGRDQQARAAAHPQFAWRQGWILPGSSNRVLLVGNRAPEPKE